jgi:hypothetical protein
MIKRVCPLVCTISNLALTADLMGFFRICMGSGCRLQAIRRTIYSNADYLSKQIPGPQSRNLPMFFRYSPDRSR